jgi:hypothetical protein
MAPGTSLQQGAAAAAAAARSVVSTRCFMCRQLTAQPRVSGCIPKARFKIDSCTYDAELGFKLVCTADTTTAAGLPSNPAHQARQLQTPHREAPQYTLLLSHPRRLNQSQKMQSWLSNIQTFNGCSSPTHSPGTPGADAAKRSATIHIATVSP